MTPIAITPTLPVAFSAEQPHTEAPTFLHEFFEHAARCWPERTAIEVPPSVERPQRRVVTYSALKRQSDALAHHLGKFVKREECVVAVLLPRDCEHVYLAQLAILKAGAAYTCIDPTFPDDQLARIFEDSGAVAVLTDRTGLARLSHPALNVPCAIDVVEWIEQAREPVEPPAAPAWLTPSNLAYVIYTSGTTGRPKGVMIEHASIANLVKADLEDFAITPQDRVGQSSSAAYDSSVEETWLALAAGSALVVMDGQTTRLGPDLVPWLRRERISVLFPSPTLLRSTGCDDPETELPELRRVEVGGEALPDDVAERWARGRDLVNSYGPTECTITSLRGKVQPGGPITIGRPVAGLAALVLNDALEEVADGQPGELCLAGIGLARGYRNQPELTERKFLPHPRLGRIYRTGDLVSRCPDGAYVYHGRIDAQVKIRGYRIELEAIEARLLECDGVREAACCVQGEDAQQKLVAFVVPREAESPPSSDALKRSLRNVLPEYMVPGRFGILGQLPTTVSGKLNRKALPTLEDPEADEKGPALPPRCPLEEKLAIAYRKILGRHAGISVNHDFFNDLGGDSLLAAMLISLLRDDPDTASLTVRDLYEARTVAELAKRVIPPDEPTSAGTMQPARPMGRPVLATLVQVLWLLLGLMLGAPLAYLLGFELLPELTERLGPGLFLLYLPLIYAVAAPAYIALTVALAVVVKKLLIGRYRPLRAPVWGSFYVRNWMVQQVVHLVPWGLLEGTVFQQAVLRALGARIGRRVHIHRGVDLVRGGWDLLDIGDDVTLSQDTFVQLVDLEDGQILVAPVTLGAGCTLEVCAGVAGGTHLEEEASLTALSFLPHGGRIPRGERWDGIPARPAGQSPARVMPSSRERELSPWLHGVALSLARNALGLFESLPALALLFVFATIVGADDEDIMDWVVDPSPKLWELLLGVALVVLSMPLTLVFQAVAMRALGRVPTGVISRWGLSYIRVWLKAGIVDSGNRWLSGSLLYPVWLRWAGMKIGRGCEISSLIDTIPELVEIGPESFLADGIYLGCPSVDRGRVTLGPVWLGKKTYLGNYIVIPGGQTLPDDVLIGVCTVTDDSKIRPGTSWFGHPPFELPKREIIDCDPRYTFRPTWPRYLNRLFWDWLRFALPLAPLLAVVAWFKALAVAEEAVSLPVLLFGVVPVLDFGVVASLCLLSLVLKWALLGRVKPAVHPLWSCWCRRWEFHYFVHDLYTVGALSALEGTLLLNWYLRAMGVKIGRNVVLGSGLAGMIDHDMLELEDGATVNCNFQAHTFEDRVLKIDRVTIRRQATVGNAAVLLYGADIGEYTYVAPLSVVMKRERLLSHRSYAGCPTRPWPRSDGRVPALLESPPAP
jgi:non-ribosomal peptide synthetase-like protein